MQCYFHALNISPYYISPMNHGSNRSERYIRTLNEMLCKYLQETGNNWPLFVAPLCYAMNTQISLVTGFSPYEMIFHVKPPDLMNFNFDTDVTACYQNSLMRTHHSSCSCISTFYTSAHHSVHTTAAHFCSIL